MERSRSNEDWVSDLKAGGSVQAAALEELRVFLLSALPACLRRYGDVPPDLVEDVVQESLLRTLDRLDSFEGRSRFTTWTATLAARVALTELRRRRWRDVSLEEITASGEISPEEYGGSGDSPEQQVTRRRVAGAMHELIASALTERQRTAVVAELQGMAQEEIGQRLGIDRNAVYKLGHDARKKLKRGMEAAGYSADDIRAAYS